MNNVFCLLDKKTVLILKKKSYNSTKPLKYELLNNLDIPSVLDITTTSTKMKNKSCGYFITAFAVWLLTDIQKFSFKSLIYET